MEPAVLGAPLAKPRRPVISCNVCQIRFNSESQAAAHYQGNRHARRLKGLEAARARQREGDRAATPGTPGPGPADGQAPRAGGSRHPWVSPRVPTPPWGQRDLPVQGVPAPLGVPTCPHATLGAAGPHHPGGPGTLGCPPVSPRHPGGSGTPPSRGCRHPLVSPRVPLCPHATLGAAGPPRPGGASTLGCLHVSPHVPTPPWGQRDPPVQEVPAPLGVPTCPPVSPRHPGGSRTPPSRGCRHPLVSPRVPLCPHATLGAAGPPRPGGAGTPGCPHVSPHHPGGSRTPPSRGSRHPWVSPRVPTPPWGQQDPTIQGVPAPLGVPCGPSCHPGAGERPPAPERPPAAAAAAVAPGPAEPPGGTGTGTAGEAAAGDAEEEKAKRLLYCALCKVAVNSLSQLEAHNKGTKHRTILEARSGLGPIRAFPRGGEAGAPPSEQPPRAFHCRVCNVRVNSEAQLKQHISSRRHRDGVAGKPNPLLGRHKKTRSPAELAAPLPFAKELPKALAGGGLLPPPLALAAAAAAAAMAAPPLALRPPGPPGALLPGPPLAPALLRPAPGPLRPAHAPLLFSPY
ncbi:zinc finger protein 385A [Struthio camelus]|uniref:zinc finger protein 385A n=1 Tax=Struthio camelus TaxID=8801 RepID=UPI003603CDA9